MSLTNASPSHGETAGRPPIAPIAAAGARAIP